MKKELSPVVRLVYSLKIQTLKCEEFENNHQIHFTQTL